jgi:hypothetical protein
LELAHRTRARRPDCSVFWVPAISRDTVERHTSRLAGCCRCRGWKRRRPTCLASCSGS